MGGISNNTSPSREKMSGGKPYASEEESKEGRQEKEVARVACAPGLLITDVGKRASARRPVFFSGRPTSAEAADMGHQSDVGQQGGLYYNPVVLGGRSC